MRTTLAVLALTFTAITTPHAQGRYPTSILVVPLTPTEQQDTSITVRFGPSVRFDIDGDGTKPVVSFPVPRSGALLAIDLNHNGVIDDGRELIGSNTGGKGAFISGFEALKSYAFDQEQLSAHTKELLLWQDANADGVSQPDELQPACNVISYISLGYTTVGPRGTWDELGNHFWLTGSASTRQDEPYFNYGIYGVVPFVIR